MDMRNVLKKICICGASVAMIASMSASINNVSAHRVHRYHYRTHRVYRRPSNRRSPQIRKINNYLGWVKHYNSTHAKKYNSWKVMIHLDNLMNGISKPQRRSALKEMFKVEETNSVLTSKSKKHAVVRMKPRKHAVHHYVRKRAKKTTKRIKRTKPTRRARRNKHSYLEKGMNYRNNSYRPSNNSKSKITNISNVQKNNDAQNWSNWINSGNSNNQNTIEDNGNIVGSSDVPAEDDDEPIDNGTADTASYGSNPEDTPNPDANTTVAQDIAKYGATHDWLGDTIVHDPNFGVGGTGYFANKNGFAKNPNNGEGFPMEYQQQNY